MHAADALMRLVAVVALFDAIRPPGLLQPGYPVAGLAARKRPLYNAARAYTGAELN